MPHPHSHQSINTMVLGQTLPRWILHQPIVHPLPMLTRSQHTLWGSNNQQCHQIMSSLLATSLMHISSSTTDEQLAAIETLCSILHSYKSAKALQQPLPGMLQCIHSQRCQCQQYKNCSCFQGCQCNLCPIRSATKDGQWSHTKLETQNHFQG